MSTRSDQSKVIDIQINTLEGKRIFPVDGTYVLSLKGLGELIGSKYESTSNFKNIYTLYYNENEFVLQLLKTEEEFENVRKRLAPENFCNFYVSESYKETVFVPRLKGKTIEWESLYPLSNTPSGTSLSFKNDNPFFSVSNNGIPEKVYSFGTPQQPSNTTVSFGTLNPLNSNPFPRPFPSPKNAFPSPKNPFQHPQNNTFPHFTFGSYE